MNLGRTGAHRRALLASLAAGLIEHDRIETTLPKAKLARSFVEKLVTMGIEGSLAARRRACADLHDRRHVSRLFGTVAPSMKDRPGGYTRIVRLGRRRSDGSEMALLEWSTTGPPAAKKKRAKKDGEEKSE